MSVRFQRANFVVSSLDRALVLYRDVLGLEVAFIKESPPDSYSYTVFEIERSLPLRFAVLSAPGQPRVMALTEVAELQRLPLPRRSAIVLEIQDIDGVLAAAEAQGFKVYPEEQLHTHDGRIGREIGMLDDDGNLVVIYRINAA